MSDPELLRVCLYHDLQIGGALRAAVELTRASAHRISYHSVVPDRTEPLAFWRSSGLDAEAVPWPPQPLRWLSEKSALRRGLEIVLSSALDRRVRQRVLTDADLVLVHPSHLLQAPSLLPKLDALTVYFAHEPRRRSFEPGYNQVQPRGLRERLKVALSDVLEPWLRWQDRHAVASARYVVCNSEYSRKRLLECYGREAIVVHLGVDSELFSPDAGIGVKRMILSVGGLEPSKGHDLLIRAVGRIAPARRPSITIVYDRGSDTYRNRLLEFAGAQGVTLELRGRVTATDLVHLYRSAAVTFGGASGEPFGLTVLESISCGTPVVAVAAGGYRETVQHGVNGQLVAGSPDEIADAIKNLLDSDRPEPEAVRDSILPYWTWEAAGERLAAALQSIAWRESQAQS